MIRLKRGANSILSMTWHDGDDIVDPGTVTISITDAQGTVVATDAATTGTGAAVRTYALAGVDDLTILTAVWSSASMGDTTEYYEVIGGFYVELGDLRALDDLSDPARYPVSALASAVDWWIDLVQNWCGIDYVPRYGHYRSQHIRSYGPLYLRPAPREILAATAEGVAVDTSGWRPRDDGKVLYAHLPGGLVEVHYTHGRDEPDGELVEAAETAIRSKLLSDRTGRPSRQTLLTNELGTVRLAQPGQNAATGIPEVDRVLNDHRYDAVMVA